MIREAKGVALHDLSFWANTLPLLEGLPQIIREYQFKIGTGVLLSLNAETGKELHDQTLARVVELVRLPEDGVVPPPASRNADRLARDLVSMMRWRATHGLPEANVSIAGCGIVTGGSCDLLWAPFVVELKLTAKLPGLRDVRQLLVYAGLLRLSSAITPEFGIVANPRRGVAVQFEIAELLMMTGGLTIDEFAARLSDFLVGAGQSN